MGEHNPVCVCHLSADVLSSASGPFPFYLIGEADVTVTRLEQQTSDVSVSVLAGAHQGRGALTVLGVYICATAQQQLHHGNAPVAHREHERRLAGLEEKSEKTERITRGGAGRGAAWRGLTTD